MTQVIASEPSKISLYERDLNLWLEQAISQLKSGDFHNLDVVNLIEELEGLAGRDRRELKSRLRTLLEHLLKRIYINLPECFNGWEITIREQRSQLEDIFEQSPSLKAIWEEAFNSAWRSALKNTCQEYRNFTFPDAWQFSHDIDSLLTIDFWEEI
ncbi:DUF29 domain-containing protein [Tumidithrix helvetica PCC 7403]|uniref:DUF29 domain-containing protein n=1 Tax=Tumidithrix helvetica TaxID=3457545 RepID=UPI003CA687F6